MNKFKLQFFILIFLYCNILYAAEDKDNNIKQDIYSPFSLDMLKWHFSFTNDLFAYRDSSLFGGIGFGFTFISEKEDDEAWFGSARVIETGIQTEYNFNQLLKISPYVYYGNWHLVFIGGLQYYIGFSLPILTDFEMHTIGLSPIIGCSISIAMVFLNIQIQYDFYKNSDYNRFVLSTIISIAKFL